MKLQDTLKSQDTEEWIDLVFYRPIGYFQLIDAFIFYDHLRYIKRNTAGDHESVLNEEYERSSEHCGVTFVPSRVRKPEDRLW